MQSITWAIKTDIFRAGTDNDRKKRLTMYKFLCSYRSLTWNRSCDLSPKLSQPLRNISRFSRWKRRGSPSSVRGQTLGSLIVSITDFFRACSAAITWKRTVTSSRPKKDETRRDAEKAPFHEGIEGDTRQTASAKHGQSGLLATGSMIYIPEWGAQTNTRAWKCLMKHNGRWPNLVRPKRRRRTHQTPIRRSASDSHRLGKETMKPSHLWISRVRSR